MIKEQEGFPCFLLDDSFVCTLGVISLNLGSAAIGYGTHSGFQELVIQRMIVLS